MQISEQFEKLVFQNGRKINFSRTINADYTNKLHWHPFVEILLSLEHGNEVSVNFIEYKMKPNDLMILQPGDLHSINNTSEGSFLVVQFPLAFLTAFNERESLLRLLPKHPFISYDPSTAENDRLLYLFKSLFDIYETDEPFKDLRISSQLLQFFDVLGHLLLSANPGENTDGTAAQYKSAKLIAEACMYISQNCSNPLTLEGVARYIGISKSYFSHLFKDYTKMTFIDFLTAERIKYAESQFLNSRKKIIDIAFECGFTSISSFNRAFKKIKGISPTEFREKLMAQT